MKNIYQKLLGACLALFAFASGALAAAPDYSPVSYTAGEVAFTPTNLLTPFITGLLLFFGTLGALALIWRFGSLILRWMGGGKKTT